jgi:hypothetical protein
MAKPRTERSLHSPSEEFRERVRNAAKDKLFIACAGFRLTSTPGHHRLTIEAARLALGSLAARSLDFFDACRRKRNVIDYDQASVATHMEAEEIVAEAQAFFELVVRWIAANHPKLAP